jgi:hypothetical protein
MLCYFILNENITYTVGRVKHRAFTKNGELKGFAKHLSTFSNASLNMVNKATIYTKTA